MADYSNFPFGDFTVAEVFALARESKDIGDEEFVKACMEAIRLNKCRPTKRAPDLGWACGKCGCANLESDLICGFCDTPRPSR